MNKKILWTLLLSLTLTACIFNFGTVGSASGGAPTEMELPTQTKLILGIINLEETEDAVTAEQAKELVPMFYVLQDLNESDTAAQEEINGLTNQVRETLTDAQVEAIDGMSLSMRDMFAIVQGNSSGSANKSGTTSTSGGVPNGMPGGMGGPPDMGGMPGGMPGGAGATSSGTTTNEDENTSPAMSTTPPSALFDAVIERLEKKLQ